MGIRPAVSGAVTYNIQRLSAMPQQAEVGKKTSDHFSKEGRIEEP